MKIWELIFCLIELWRIRSLIYFPYDIEKEDCKTRWRRVNNSSSNNLQTKVWIQWVTATKDNQGSSRNRYWRRKAWHGIMNVIQLRLWEELGPIQMRSFMEALNDLNYQHLKVIRLWKVDLQDEGLRSICNYIDKVNSV